MNIKELKQLSKEELSQKLLEDRQALYHAREQFSAGKDKNHAQMKGLKKEIAKISTCISELSHS